MNKKAKRITFLGLIILLGVVVVSIIQSTGVSNSEEEQAITTPQFQEVSVHDPSIIRDENSGYYYVFGTHISGAKSKDLIEWTNFTNGYTALGNTLYDDLSDNLSESFEWAGENDADSIGGYGVWAPEVIWNDEFVNEDGSKGAYTIYYSVSSTYKRSAIGLASAQEIEGPYKYEDTILYSDFLKYEGYDSNSEVNKHWENTNIRQLIEEGVISDVNENWFTDAGDYNTSEYPNAIDPNLLYDKEGKLWLTYGSWSGGTFALKIDQETGLPIYPGIDSETEDGRMVDRYFGTKIAAGYGRSAEGTYAIYDENENYYYLFLTYGGLTADGGYQVRTFRSENVDGPYKDANGEDAVFPETFYQGMDNFPGNIDHMHIGNKILGNFYFERQLGESGSEPGYGYLSPGHNSIYQDADTDQMFIAFHTRFPDRGENHELRIHQMFMNENGWPVVAPHRYAGEELTSLDEGEVVGEYKYINHGKDILGKLNSSELVALNEDMTISGEVEGTWELRDGQNIELVIDEEIFNGTVIRQWDPLTEQTVVTFSALSDRGNAIWGSQSEDLTPEEIVNNVAGQLSFDETPTDNLNLPTKAVDGTQISWESSDRSFITNDGVINFPENSERPVDVSLVAKISNSDETIEKKFSFHFPVEDEDEEGELIAHYDFNENLDNAVESNFGPAVGVGDRLDNEEGSIRYVENERTDDYALYLDGNSGVRLPDGLISSNHYAVSIWVNPEIITDFSTIFFGSKTESSWISLVPTGPVEETMLWSNNGSDWYDAPSGTVLPLDEWSHLVFSVDNGKVNLYLNGENMFSGTDFPNIFNVDDAVFSVGVNYWDTPFQGMIDELKVFSDTALTEKEVLELYNAQ